jgi:hypothetical protein
MPSIRCNRVRQKLWSISIDSVRQNRFRIKEQARRPDADRARTLQLIWGAHASRVPSTASRRRFRQTIFHARGMSSGNARLTPRPSLRNSAFSSTLRYAPAHATKRKGPRCWKRGPAGRDLAESETKIITKLLFNVAAPLQSRIRDARHGGFQHPLRFRQRVIQTSAFIELIFIKLLLLHQLFRGLTAFIAQQVDLKCQQSRAPQRQRKFVFFGFHQSTMTGLPRPGSLFSEYRAPFGLFLTN